MNARSETTRVIQLTPPGRAAVAVVLVEGPEVTTLVKGLIHRADRTRLTDLPIGCILVGRWGTSEGEEVVVCRRASNVVEVHCHGGSAAIEVIIARLVEAGCRRIDWRNWIRQSAADPIRAAAQIALAEAPTARTAAVLLDQFEGALSNAVRRVISAAAANDWLDVRIQLDSILAQRNLGLHLTTPWRVVIMGRPNVGKSSLLNALVGFERAIVYDLPGTTRDVVTARTAIDGWPILLADTAGVRDTSDDIESAGVERATSAAAQADLVLLVDDALNGGHVTLSTGVPMLRVLNKIDLRAELSASERERIDAFVSATQGIGIAELVAAIGKALVPAPPSRGAAVAFAAKHLAQLEAAREAALRRDLQAVMWRLRPLIE